MASLFGAGSRANSDVKRSTNVRFQSSVQGRPRAIGAGQNRVAGNLVWYSDFKAIPVSSSSGGKGGGGSGKGKVGSYKYSASFIVSLGQTISAVATIYNGNQIDFLIPPSAAVLADYQALGIEPVYGNAYG